MEYGAHGTAKGRAHSAGLRGGDGMENEGSETDVLVFLSHSRLPRGALTVYAILFSGRGIVHGELVEPDAAVFGPIRLSERDAAGLFHLQAAGESDGRAARS